MKTSATNRKLRLLLTGIQNSTLVPRPEFQRRLVWSNKHKLAFLKTVLGEYPFPEIYVAAGEVDSTTGEGSEMLVDGQQRISTLYQYFKESPDLKLTREIPPYRELTEEQKIRFLEYEVVIRDLGKLDIDDILEVFRRINSTNYALNAMEIHNARFDGEMKQLGDDIAANPLFQSSQFFTSQEVRRMGDTKFALSVAITLMSGYFNRDDALEAYLDKYNEEFENRNQVLREFETVAELIMRCNFDKHSRAWKKADLFTLLVELHRAAFKREVKLEPSHVRDRINQFYRNVEAASHSSDERSLPALYYRASLQATNDRGSRITRGEIVQNILDPSYNPTLRPPSLVNETAL